MEITKSMDNNSYTGKMYFVGTTEDILDFENFRFDEAHQIIEFDFSCDESNSGSYGHEDIATSASGYLYATKKFSPYDDLKGEVHLQFDSRVFRFLSDDQGEQFLYVKGTWHQGSKKRFFHGLLKLKGQGSPHIYRKAPMIVPPSPLFKTMRHFAYGGDLYFVGAIDVLTFNIFRFDEELKIIEFDFSCQKPKSEPYRHRSTARKTSGYAYLTEGFCPYEVSDSEVQLEFKPASIRFLADREQRPFIHLQGSWHEGKSEWLIHGLLRG